MRNLLRMTLCAGLAVGLRAWVGAGESNDVDELPGIGALKGAAPAAIVVADPLEPVNRAFYHFNDKLYFWVLQPVSRGYAYVMPAAARRGVRNFFGNLAMPIRLGNCLLQGDGTGAWVECRRFAINTTEGGIGFDDYAKRCWELPGRRADFGQTLGRYGIGPSIYINWPVLGPLSARDSVGHVGDHFLNPLTYLVTDLPPSVGLKAYETVNNLSLRPDEYERFKQAAIDPYLAMRDAYYQYRRSMVEGGAGGATNAPVTSTR
jgi:phospholipid-binding lipoprotein MlaA